jgi:hypothetical protein
MQIDIRIHIDDNFFAWVAGLIETETRQALQGGGQRAENKLELVYEVYDLLFQVSSLFVLLVRSYLFEQYTQSLTTQVIYSRGTVIFVTSCIAGAVVYVYMWY